MASTTQRLFSWGRVLAGFAANERRTITPGLVDVAGNVLNARKITVVPEWNVKVVSQDQANGTFDLQNISDVALGASTVIWYASAEKDAAPFGDVLATGLPKTTALAPEVTGSAAGPASIPVEIFNGQKDISRIAATGLATLAQCRNGLIMIDTVGAAVIVTLPTGTVAENGLEVILKREGANLATVAGGGGDTVDGAANVALPVDYDSVTLVYMFTGLGAVAGTDWKIV